MIKVGGKLRSMSTVPMSMDNKATWASRVI